MPNYRPELRTELHTEPRTNMSTHLRKNLRTELRTELSTELRTERCAKLRAENYIVATSCCMRICFDSHGACTSRSQVANVFTRGMLSCIVLHEMSCHAMLRSRILAACCCVFENKNARRAAIY